MKFNHVTILVRNVAESLKFYIDFLGMELAERPNFDFPGAWIKINDTQLIHLIEGPLDVVVSGRRSNHFAMDISDMDSLVEKVKASSYTFEGPKARVDGHIQLFIADPDGYYFEFGKAAF